MKIYICLFFLFVLNFSVYPQDQPILSKDAFVTLAGEWDGEYILTKPDGSFDTLDIKIDASITNIDGGIAADFTMISKDGNIKTDTDSIIVSPNGNEIDMGRVWSLNEIIDDGGDTILMMDRKEQTDNNEIHYLRSILHAGPDKFAILTAVRRKEGEDYFLEEQYRFTRKK